MQDHSMAAFDTPSLRMQPCHLIEVGTPPEDVGRIMAAVTAIDPLAIGPNYDSVAYQTAPGVERYRPLDGAAAGVRPEVLVNPGPVTLFFEIEGGVQVVAAAVEAIYQAHSYQQPTIRVTGVLSARARGLDDRDNPNRWWNAAHSNADPP